MFARKLSIAFLEKFKIYTVVEVLSNGLIFISSTENKIFVKVNIWRSNVMFTFTGDVMIDVDEMGCSYSSITTTGLANCYGFLIDGKYGNVPFCFLDHHSYSVDQQTPYTLTEILHSLIKDLADNTKEHLINLKLFEKFDFKKIQNVTLLVCGGIQENPDHYRAAFALLQSPIDQQLLAQFSGNPDGQHLCQQLNYRTFIIDAVGYLLSDEMEEMAAAAGKYITSDTSAHLLDMRKVLGRLL